MSDTKIDLSKYYRQPGLTVKLPSHGQFMPLDSIKYGPDDTVQIYPMRLADEMMLKNPDALMSGSALESLFESCIPDIKFPGLISSIDLDVLLLGVRVATYGRKMELETQCPACSRDLEFECDLPAMLQTQVYPEGKLNNEVRLSDDLVAEIRPFNVTDMNTMGRKVYEEERRMQQIEAADNLNEVEREAQRRNLFKRVASFETEMLARSVVRVISPEGDVTDNQAILDLVRQAPAPWLTKLKNCQEELSQNAMDKRIDASCEFCKHEWKTQLNFDPTSFFAADFSV
jgi:hypothetical protein